MYSKVYLNNQSLVSGDIMRFCIPLWENFLPASFHEKCMKNLMNLILSGGEMEYQTQMAWWT